MNRLAQLKKLQDEEKGSAVGHFSKFMVPVDETPLVDKQVEEPSRDLAVTNNVDELIPLALEVHRKIMKETHLDQDDEDYVAKANLVLKTAQSILTTQIKVDENMLRRKKQDDVMTILQELRDEEKKQAARGLIAAE